MTPSWLSQQQLYDSLAPTFVTARFLDGRSALPYKVGLSNAWNVISTMLDIEISDVKPYNCLKCGTGGFEGTNFFLVWGVEWKLSRTTS